MNKYKEIHSELQEQLAKAQDRERDLEGEEPGAARQAAGGGRRRWGQDPRGLEGADGGAGRAHRQAREAPGGCAAPRPCGAALRPVPAGRAGACSCVVGGAVFRACTTFPSRTNVSLWHECCPRSPRRGASQVLRKVADQAEKKLARAARERAVNPPHPPPPPPLPYKVDTSCPSLRTNWTRLVPAGEPHGPARAERDAHGEPRGAPARDPRKPGPRAAPARRASRAPPRDDVWLPSSEHGAVCDVKW